MARISIIFNPTAGRRRREALQDVCARLSKRGWVIELLPTRARGDAEHMAGKIANLPDGSRPDVLAVAGGDGTIGEALNGLSAAISNLPIAIIPLGTANVLAAEIGLLAKPDIIADTIDRCQAQSIYIGRANGRVFTLMVGVGVDAHIVADLNVALKRRIGKGAYIWSAIRKMTGFNFPNYHVRIDGGPPINVAAVIIAKGRFYGGRYLAAPQASLNDPKFQICLFERKGAFHMLRYGIALSLGRLPKAKGYRVLEGYNIAITGPEGDPIQGDGDIIGELPAHISIVPSPVQLIFPAR